MYNSLALTEALTVSVVAWYINILISPLFPMSRAERKTFHDLLEDHPEGLEIRLDNFYDVNDANNPDTLDRIVGATFDAEQNISYSGVCVLKTPEGMSEDDVSDFKAYLKTAWNRGDPIAFLRSDGENLPILEPPTGGIPEAMADIEVELTETEDTSASEDIGENAE